LIENQQNTKNVTQSKRKIAAIAAAVLVIALIVGLTTSILMSNQNPSNNQTSAQNNPQSWMKVGAYATYEGQASIIGIDVSFNAKMQIVDLNQTHIQVATDFNMSTPYGATQNRTTTWVNRENLTFQQEGMTLNNTYNTQVTLAKLGTRSCTVYEYSNDGISAAYYIDDRVQWPVKMVMTSPTSINGLTYSMDINLVDTNIPGL
jgi:hypothetical protein